MKKLDDLLRWFEDCRSGSSSGSGSCGLGNSNGGGGVNSGVLIALSGGVDSALVAHAAFSSLGDSAIAVTADYRTLSQDELASAESVCREIGIKQIMLRYDELENRDFVRNDESRCYHCRMELGGRLTRLADGMAGSWRVVDGTNLDDLGDYRPGIEAMRSHMVRSPLVETGFNKGDVRAAARHVGLSIHDRPSNSCLASRIPWGERITAERLARIEAGERIVRQMSGARQVRVRDVGGTARIEVEPESLYVFDDRLRGSHADGAARGKRDRGDGGRRGLLGAVAERLELLGFDDVALDPEGYRPGKINKVAAR